MNTTSQSIHEEKSGAAGLSIITMLLIFFIMYLFSSAIFSQDIAPPGPVENKFFDSMVGKWTGETTTMGMTSTTETNIKWGFNHQFIIIEFKSVNNNNPQYKYSGMGIFGIDEKGNIKSWWFDDWGLMGSGSGTGTISGNIMEISSKNDIYNEKRSFELKGSEVIINASGSWIADGQEYKFEEKGMMHKN